MRECGVDEAVIEQIRIYDRADFNSNRRFYRWTNDVAEYLEEMANIEKQTEIHSVADLLDEIENENLYRTLLAVDKRTLQITHEIKLAYLIQRAETKYRRNRRNKGFRHIMCDWKSFSFCGNLYSFEKRILKVNPPHRHLHPPFQEI